MKCKSCESDVIEAKWQGERVVHCANRNCERRGIIYFAHRLGEQKVGDIPELQRDLPTIDEARAMQIEIHGLTPEASAVIRGEFEKFREQLIRELSE